MKGRRVRFGPVILVGVLMLAFGAGVASAGNPGFGLPVAVIGLVVLLTGYFAPRRPAEDRSEP